jgi:hypothetical protein
VPAECYPTHVSTPDLTISKDKQCHTLACAARKIRRINPVDHYEVLSDVVLGVTARTCYI